MKPDKVHYTNVWYVEWFDDAAKVWRPRVGSVGSRTYIKGYINALAEFYPSPAYRVIDNKGEIYTDIPPKGVPHLNTAKGGVSHV